MIDSGPPQGAAVGTALGSCSFGAVTAGAKVVASTRPPAAGGRGSRPLRFLDRTLAAAILRILGLLRRRRALPGGLKRIGIMKTTGIGDMVLATAIARDVAGTFPGASVIVFASSENAALARLVPGVEVVELLSLIHI